MKRCVYNVSARWTVKTDKFTLFLYCHFLVLLSTTVCSQKTNKQIVNIADENLAYYSFLSRYHYTKSKNYLRRRYRNRHWIPMFIGTPCTTRCFYTYCINEASRARRAPYLSFKSNHTYYVRMKYANFRFVSFHCSRFPKLSKLIK